MNIPTIFTEDTLRLAAIEHIVDYLYDNDAIKHRRVDKSNLTQITNEDGMINLDLLKKLIQFHKTYTTNLVQLPMVDHTSPGLVNDLFNNVLEKFNRNLEKKRSHSSHGQMIPITKIDDGEHFVFHRRHDSESFTSQIFKNVLEQQKKIVEEDDVQSVQEDNDGEENYSNEQCVNLNEGAI